MAGHVVTVVDYGVGNLFSVRRALESVGAEVVLTSDPACLRDADRLVLPGVGAFADGVRELRERGLVNALRAYGESGRPMLGICLGMQMLASSSTEFGMHEGLGLIPGAVVEVPRQTITHQPQRVPNIGWCRLEVQPHARGDEVIGDRDDFVYMVHSYHLRTDEPRHTTHSCVYGGHQLTAVVRRGQVWGTQFHPEKSGPVGLRMLKAFLSVPTPGTV